MLIGVILGSANAAEYVPAVEEWFDKIRAILDRYEVKPKGHIRTGYQTLYHGVTIRKRRSVSAKSADGFLLIANTGGDREGFFEGKQKLIGQWESHVRIHTVANSRHLLFVEFCYGPKANKEMIREIKECLAAVSLSKANRTGPAKGNPANR